MNELLLYILTYLLVGILFFLLFNFLTNNFLTTYIIVKASRGKKILVEVHGQMNIGYRWGVFDGKILKYKSLGTKLKKTLKVEKHCILRKLNVACVHVEDEENTVLKPDFTAVSGFDAVKFDNLLVRALTLPQILDKKEKIIMLFGFLITIVGVVVCIFLLNDIKGVINGLEVTGVIG